jgi:hypothetical protein
MNRLIEKLNKQGFDVTDNLQFNNITLARRRESFNWYVYLNKYTSNMNEVRESLEGHMDGIIKSFPTNYYVHSQNPVGVENIKGLMSSYINTLEGE